MPGFVQAGGLPGAARRRGRSGSGGCRSVARCWVPGGRTACRSGMDWVWACAWMFCCRLTSACQRSWLQARASCTRAVSIAVAMRMRVFICTVFSVLADRSVRPVREGSGVRGALRARRVRARSCRSGLGCRSRLSEAPRALLRGFRGTMCTASPGTGAGEGSAAASAMVRSYLSTRVLSPMARATSRASARPSR